MFATATSCQTFGCVVGVDCDISILGFMLSALDRIKLVRLSGRSEHILCIVILKNKYIYIYNVLFCIYYKTEYHVFIGSFRFGHATDNGTVEVKEGFPCNGNPVAGVPAQESFGAEREEKKKLKTEYRKNIYIYA